MPLLLLRLFVRLSLPLSLIPSPPGHSFLVDATYRPVPGLRLGSISDESWRSCRCCLCFGFASDRRCLPFRNPRRIGPSSAVLMRRNPSDSHRSLVPTLKPISWLHPLIQHSPLPWPFFHFCHTTCPSTALCVCSPRPLPFLGFHSRTSCPAAPFA